MLSTYPRRPKRKRSQRRGSSRTFSSRSNRSQRRYSGASEFLTHVQLGDAPRAPIQQSTGEGEFRQHDGVVTILMFYRRRASPKHYNDMIEVEYGGRGHRTWLRNDLNDQLVCLDAPPVGERSRNSKNFLRITKIYLWRDQQRVERRVHLHTLVDR